MNLLRCVPALGRASSVPGRGLVAVATVGLLFMVAPSAGAQETYDVRGIVADSTGGGIDGAMVVALALPDSLLIKFSLSNGNGSFTLSRVPAGEYLLQITMVGHQTVRRAFSITTADVDAGTIKLEVLAVEMDALVVSVDHVPFVNRRDTLDYNARAFVTRPNATVEELLARLPGIEVDPDGTIRAQGEEVRNVLVDGKEFFGSDPTIATRNLPADAIERIQVYDKQSDMAEFTGIADGQEERTINLQLREDARRGYFGQAVGGLGGGLEPAAVIEAQPDGRTRYNESLNINRFSPTTQLALLGNANNVNEAGFAWGNFVNFSGGAQGLARGGNRGGGGGRGGAGDRDGGGQGGIQLGGGRNDGFTETMSLGLNANHDFSDDRWIRSSYFYTGLDNVQRQTTQQQQLLGSNAAALQNAAADQVTANTTHRVNLNAQYAFSDGHDLRLRGNLNVGSSSMTSLQSSETTTLDGRVQNTGLSNNVVEGNDLGGSARLTWRKRLAENGRSLVAEATTSIQEPELYGDLETTTGIANRDGDLIMQDLIQQQSRTGRTLSLSQRLSLTQPVGERGIFEVFGERRAVNEDQNNSVFDIGTGTPVFNDLLSSGFERTYSYLRGGFRFNRNTADTRFVVGLQVQASKLDGTILDRDEHIENGYTHVLPSANFRIQLNDAKTLNFRYTTSTREPSMTELQPFADNTNPIRTYVGNPNLTPEYSHSFNADYRFFDQFSFVNLFTYLRFSYTSDDIVQSRVIDEQALQTVMPVNIDHSWSTNGGVTYGRPIRSVGARINLNYTFNYTRGVEILNGLENNSTVLRNTIDASIDNRNKDLFDVRAGARFSFNDVENSLNQELNQGYLDKTFYGNGMLHYGAGWTFSATLNYRLYDEDVFGAGDRNVAMLQASISKLAMDNRVELELVGFDILDQNKGVAYTTGTSFIQERRTESLGRYVMLKVMYRLGSRGVGAARGGGGGRRR
ncbi:MAG: TonB-dependent receptor [Gemmatimonadetes bacterium]|nr:TonB-dependent receptor [Gemmatimonadota bacterium]